MLKVSVLSPISSLHPLLYLSRTFTYRSGNSRNLTESSRYNYLELTAADLSSELGLAFDTVMSTPTPPPTTGYTYSLYAGICIPSTALS
jgi:hypothetical protein